VAKNRAETFRLKRLCRIEDEVRAQGFSLIAGVDEAGRGPLAGPVVAAACLLPEGYVLRGVDDSKKLSPDERYALYQELILQSGVYFGLGIVEAAEIDRLNIHNATLVAMERAVSRLDKRPDYLLVDGKFVPDGEIPAASVVQGDHRVQSIAAASILAKVARDHIMLGYDNLYPDYGFKNHKGYGTKEHREAIERVGVCPIHRATFVKGKKECQEA